MSWIHPVERESSTVTSDSLLAVALAVSRVGTVAYIHCCISSLAVSHFSDCSSKGLFVPKLDGLPQTQSLVVDMSLAGRTYPGGLFHGVLWMTDRPVAPQPLPFVLSLSASCELPQKDSEQSWAAWCVLASLPRPLQNVLPLVHSNQAISDDGSAMPPRQVRAWSVLLLQILFWVSQISHLGKERLCKSGNSNGLQCSRAPHGCAWRGKIMHPGAFVMMGCREALSPPQHLRSQLVEHKVVKLCNHSCLFSSMSPKKLARRLH